MLFVETTQLKLERSAETGALIGFVSRNPNTQKLRGVREDSYFGKKICILARELIGKLQCNKLYDVELKHMHRREGYVIVSAKPTQFVALVDMLVIRGERYQVTVRFGNKTVYFDPMDGSSVTSRTLEGAVRVLNARDDIQDKESVVELFIKQSLQLLTIMNEDKSRGIIIFNDDALNDYRE